MSKTIFCLLLVSLIFAGTAIAQDETDCSAETYRELLELYSARITEDTADFVMSRLVAEISQRRAECAGWAFNGTTGQVIRPFELPAGFYIVRAAWDDFGSLELVTTTEACERDVRYSRLSTGGHIGGSDEGILELSADCSIMIDVDTHGKWSLEIEAL